MNSHTTRPPEEWTIPASTYQVGSSTASSAVYNTDSSSTAVPYSTDSLGTTIGLTTSAQLASSRSGQTVISSSRISFATSETEFTSFSQSSTSAGSTYTDDNQSASNFSSTGRTVVSAVTENDSSRMSSRATSAQTSSQSSISYASAPAGSATSSAGTLSTTVSGPSSTTRTGSGTSTTYSTYTFAVDLSTITTSSTDGTLASVFTTNTSTRTTTTTTDWSSTTTTLYSSLTGQATTLTTATADVTWTDHTTTALTATSHVRTTWLFNDLLQDTVFLMSGGRGADDYNLGEILWSFSHTSLPVTATTAGIFSDLYASTSGATLTVSDYRKTSSSSAAVTAVSISSSIATLTDGAGTTYQTLISSNGTSYATTDATSTSYSASYSLGDVSSTLSTWTGTTTTDTNLPKSTYSSTIFTHTGHVTGYETTSSAWTSTTTSSTWGFATSGTSSRPVVFSSTLTSSVLSVRSTTEDSILFESFTTTGTGTNTVRILLGSVSTTTSRFYSTESTFTRPTYAAVLHSTASQYVVTDSGPGGFSTITRSDAFGITRWTEQRMEPHVRARPGDDNLPQLDEIRHQCHPYGIAGFGGLFTVTDLSVHVTTTQGLASGSTFAEATIIPPAAVSACVGVSMIPVPSTARFSGLDQAAGTSLLSTPSVMASMISLAVTWTSTTTTGPATSDTITTSRAATHTLAVTSAITGTFFSADAMTLNSVYRTELLPYAGGAAVGGFVAGDNALGKSVTVLARQGWAAWTEFTGRQSTASVTGSTSGSAGSVSWTLPGSHGIVLTQQPVLTAAWSAAGQASIFSSAPHRSHA